MTKLTLFPCLVAFTLWDIGQYVHCIVCKPGCEVMNFEVNLIFIKLFVKKKIGLKNQTQKLSYYSIFFSLKLVDVSSFKDIIKTIVKLINNIILSNLKN